MIKNRNNAMTLMEITVAMAIAGLLMAGVLGAVRALARDGMATALPHDQAVTEAGLRNVLEADIMHARRYRATDKGFELETSSALDPATMEIDHVPAVVAYEIRPAGKRNWLVRSQTSDIQKPQTELVLAGVKAIAIKRSPEPTSQDASTPDETPIDASQWRPIPDGLAVTVDLPDRSILLAFGPR